MPSDTSTAVLRASDLTAVLTGDHGPVAVLDGLTLAVAAGEIVDIVGPSGSGKSTLLRALARLMPGATGEISVDGRLAKDVPAAEWRTLITLLPQKPSLIDGSIRDNLLLPWRFKVRGPHTKPIEEDLSGALQALGLGDVALDRDASRLSVGQQARLAFARVWLASPRVLLLDEAEASLDDESAASLSSAVAHFAAEGGRLQAGTSPAGVVRVRHRADDGLALRRLQISAGKLVEVDR